MICTKEVQLLKLLKEYKPELMFNSLLQPQDPGFHGQDKVYGDLGEEMLEHSFEGKINSRAVVVAQ